MNKKENVAIIGLGYVGLPLALFADKKGYNVFGIDNNAQTIKSLNKKVSRINDEIITKLLPKNKITFSLDPAHITKCDIVIVCVPTPVDDKYMPDLTPVRSACQTISSNLQKGQLIILESTVNPGVSEEVIVPILEESGLKAGVDFHVAHCPERINPGDPNWNVENIPRVVGSTSKEGLKRAATFYRSILGADVKEMNTIKEAEAVKIVENSFRDINIAFVNELAMSFDKLGINLVNVINGASTKPFAFMAHYPGCGVGGHCIPVDPYYLIEYAKKNDFHHDFLSRARRVNNHMPLYTAEKVMKGLNQKKIAINGSKVAVLGLSYKAEVGDDRESPSYKIIKHLKELGAEVVSFDPFVLEKSIVKTLEGAISGAKAVVIATGHKIFKELTPSQLQEVGVEVLVDGRNCMNKESFDQSDILFEGVGR